MNRRTFFAGIAGLAGCTSTTRPRLNVYNWSNYVAPDTIPNFEREFGVRVRYGIFESNEEMLAKALKQNFPHDMNQPAVSIVGVTMRRAFPCPVRASSPLPFCSV